MRAAEFACSGMVWQQQLREAEGIRKGE
jgi:hypothetical protein